MKNAIQLAAILGLAIAAMPANARPWHDDDWGPGYHGGYHHGWHSGTTVIIHDAPPPPPVVVYEEAPPPVIVRESVIVREVPRPAPVIVREAPPEDVIVTNRTAIQMSAATRDILVRDLRRGGKHAKHHDFEIGRQISADYKLRELSEALLQRLDPLPPAYRYARVDDDIVLLSPRGNVLDVVQLR